MKNIFILAAVFILAFKVFPELFSGKPAANPFRMPTDIHSVSHSDAPFSPIVNPVFNDVSGAARVAYRYMKYDDTDRGNHYLMLRILGFSFSYVNYDHLYDSESGLPYSADSSFFNISRGLMINNVFGLGTGYSFAKSDEDFLDDYSGWHLGFLYRPLRYLSFGFVFNDLRGSIGGRNLKRSETYSVSFRPFVDSFTLSADATRMQGEDFSDMKYTYAAHLRIFSDITIYAKADTDKNLTCGVRMPFFTRDPNNALSSSMVLDYAGYSGSDTYAHSGGLTIPVYDYKDAIQLPENNYLYITIRGSYRENEPRQIFRDRSVVFYDFLNAVRNAGADNSIEGIVLEIDSVGLGFAQTQELREELAGVKRGGKPVFAIMKNTGNQEYYLASVASRIYYTPNTAFKLTGLSARVYYLKGLLDNIGVTMETVRRGQYKTALEPFTEEGMTEEFRENIDSILSDLNDQFLSDISLDRPFNKNELKNFLDEGILTPAEAESRGFIDMVAYPGEAFYDISERIVLVDLKRYINEKKVEHMWGTVPGIAVIYAGGNIIRGNSSVSGYFDTIGDDTYKRALKRAFSDRNVKAVVIRVDSGGGSAAASDFMWHYLIDYRKRYDKPVVFSFGNIAASGGYYIACTGDEIFSSGGTLTGSIGAIFGKISVEELYDKLGIKKEVVKKSEFADAFSEARRLTEKERALARKEIDFIYDRFTDKVVEGRKIDRALIAGAAEGRVFTGAQAKEKDLVDQKGGLILAIEYAATLSGIDTDYEVQILPDERLLFPGMFNNPEIESLSRFFGSLARKAGIIDYKDENILYLQPFHIEIK